MSGSFEFVVSQYLQTTKAAETGPVEYRKKITLIALAKQHSVMEWIELAVGEKLFQSMGSINTEERLNDMQIVLKDGTMLCTFMLKIKPACITQKINPLAKKFEFYAFETIGFFLKATKDLGVTETFAPADLFERKNMEKVLTLLCSLGRTANKKRS